MKNAISGDIDFIEKLNNSMFSGYVHSTFTRTINIQCFEDGELFTIACKQIDNAPNTLIVDIDNFTRLDIEVNDRVYVKNKILYIANKLAISIDHVANWVSVLPVYPCNADALNLNIEKTKNYVQLHGTGGGIKKNAQSQSPFEVEISNMLEKRTQLLLNELANHRFSSALPHAVSLIGLGPGLTPSGDDFLTGLFTIYHMKNSPFYPYQSFCEEVLKQAKPLTNDISYMTLKKAAIGKVRESILSFLHALLGENDEDLYLSLNKLLNIGSSSGTDIALGMVFGLETTIQAGG